MSIQATVESWPERETIRREKIFPGTVYYYLDEYVGRLLLARSCGFRDEGAIIHSQEGYSDDPTTLTMDKIRQICVPKAVIAKVMPWHSETIAVHDTKGEAALLTIQHVPSVVLNPQRQPDPTQ